MELLDYTKDLCSHYKRSHQLKAILQHSWIKDNPNAVNNTGNTLLHFASKLGENKLVSVLLHLQVDLNLQNEDGNTALHLSIQYGFISIGETLIKHNCELEVRRDCSNHFKLIIGMDSGITP